MANGRSKYRFDTEILISAIEQRKLLWDTSSEDYKNRNLKDNAWAEVADILIETFEDLDETQRQEAIKLIQQRWRSARDAYRRDRTKIKTTKSGQASKQIKKYIYFENLKFLDIVLDLNQTDTNFDSEETEDQLDVSENEDPPNEYTLNEDLPHPKSTHLNKRKKKDDIDDKLIAFLDNTKKSDDRGDRAFLESLLPTLEGFDEAKRLQFRAEVLRIMMEIKNIPTFSQIHYNSQTHNNSFHLQAVQSLSYPQSHSYNYTANSDVNSILQSNISTRASGSSTPYSRPQSNQSSYVSSPPSSTDTQHSIQTQPPSHSYSNSYNTLSIHSSDSLSRPQSDFSIQPIINQPTLLQLTDMDIPH